MRWNKITTGNGTVLCWECVFENVPYTVKVYDHCEGVMSVLYLVWNAPFSIQLDSKIYPSIDDAKYDVESFVLDHLAQYSAQVFRECFQDKIVTWRKLKEQLDQIPEDQLDEVIRILDVDNDWIGEPKIIQASQDMYEDNDHRDCTEDNVITEDAKLVIENGKYYLSIEL